MNQKTDLNSQILLILCRSGLIQLSKAKTSIYHY